MADLGSRAMLAPDVFEKALDKLWVHGGALVDGDDLVRRGAADWRRTYDAQRAHKRDQLARMRRYAETSSCRMLQLVEHFGDQNDPGTPCGLCDVCADATCVAQSFRAPSGEEQDAAARVVAALRERDGRAVGQLHREVFGDGSVDRKTLEHVLGALARASEVRMVGDEFVKEGTTIAFQRVFLAPGARARGGPAATATRRPCGWWCSRRPRADAASAGRATGPARRAVSARALRARGAATPWKATRRHRTRPLHGRRSSSRLRSARGARRRAKKRGIPAFRILSDRTLVGVARATPTDEVTLLEVSGIGPGILAKYGRALLSIVAHSTGGR